MEELMSTTKEQRDEWRKKYAINIIIHRLCDDLDARDAEAQKVCKCKREKGWIELMVQQTMAYCPWCGHQLAKVQ